MKLSKLLILGLVLSSCATQQRCAERFPAKEIDSSSIDTVYIHDTCYIPHPKKETTFKFDLPVQVAGGEPFNKEEKKGNTTAIVDIHNGKIKVTCKEDAYKDTIAFLRKQITKKEKKTIIPQPVVKYFEPWDLKPLRWYFGITSLLAIGFVAGKWFKVF